MIKKIKVALIGYGRWGKIIEPYIKKYFNIKYIANSKSNLKKIWEDTEVKAVFIITPIDTHYELACKALLNNKYVFIEKPTAKYSKEISCLKKISEIQSKVIFTDYTWTFSPTLKKVKLDNYKNLEFVLWRTANREQDLVKYSLLPHVLSWLFFIAPDINLKKENIKIDVKIGTNLNITCIKKDNKIIWEPHKRKDKHNLKGSIRFFKKIIKGKAESNIDFAIKITHYIEQFKKYKII
ncbi:MAG: Gfo/Idh/MocA family oxidoreductase [bacterium]